MNWAQVSGLIPSMVTLLLADTPQLLASPNLKKYSQSMEPSRQLPMVSPSSPGTSTGTMERTTTTPSLPGTDSQ